jgi:hypothetical protein
MLGYPARIRRWMPLNLKLTRCSQFLATGSGAAQRRIRHEGPTKAGRWVVLPPIQEPEP